MVRWLLLASCIGGSGGALPRDLGKCAFVEGANVLVDAEGARPHCGVMTAGVAALQSERAVEFADVEIHFDGSVLNGEGLLILAGCPATGRMLVERFEDGVLSGKFTGFVNRKCHAGGVDNIAVGAVLVDVQL